MTGSRREGVCSGGASFGRDAEKQGRVYRKDTLYPLFFVIYFYLLGTFLQLAVIKWNFWFIRFILTIFPSLFNAKIL